MDSFIHNGPNGQHYCLVFETLGESVRSLQKNTGQGSLPLNTVKSIARQTLLALEYLHTYNLIHTGTPDCILTANTCRFACRKHIDRNQAKG